VSTVLEELLARLRALDSGGDGQERPAAILWADPARSFEGLIEQARALAAEVLVLGPYAPAKRQGPGVWLRCVIDRTLPEVTMPPGRTPIVYLPGYSKQQLRAGEDCPSALQPLVELVFRGVLWTQANGSDWTPAAFLGSAKGLGLRIAGDRETQSALLRALPEVALCRVEGLRERTLDARVFDELLNPDVFRGLLRWMGDPAAAKAAGAERWAAFVSQSKQRLGFDPVKEGPLAAAERLADGHGDWEEVWRRLGEAPGAYPGILAPLARARPKQALLADPQRWLAVNDDAEESLTQALTELVGQSHAKVCAGIAELDRRHGTRRASLWARMGRADLALLLGPLARLAESARSPVGGLTPEEIALDYTGRGWLADAAAWEALAQAKPAHEDLIRRVVAALLGEWLERGARALQGALEKHPLPGSPAQAPVEAEAGGCLVFADGLRYDVGARLAERLEARGLRATLRHRWAALPTVTATGKPAVTPATASAVGTAVGAGFAPSTRAGKPLDARMLRDAIRAAGYQVLSAEDLGFPETSAARGWIELGQIDKRGHEVGIDLARDLDVEIERLVERIDALLKAGWTSVRVVTDHGWLLLPGGLPKVDLPRHLTADRWARCADLPGTFPQGVVAVPWHWNGAAFVATAPGSACFNQSPEYAHGGVSPQECVTPDILVVRAGESAPGASIEGVAWRKMRMLVQCAGSPAGVRADVRLGTATGKSVLKEPKPVEGDGAVSFVIEDDHEDKDLMVVLLDSQGTVIAQRPTRVGATS
jgi:hypothetical protein